MKGNESMAYYNYYYYFVPPSFQLAQPAGQTIYDEVLPQFPKVNSDSGRTEGGQGGRGSWLMFKVKKKYFLLLGVQYSTYCGPDREAGTGQ